MRPLLVILAAVFGRVFGECNLPKAQENFDMKKLSGEWFENAFASTAYDKPFRCKVFYNLLLEGDYIASSLYDFYYPESKVTLLTRMLDNGYFQLSSTAPKTLEKIDRKLNEERSQSTNTIGEGEKDAQGFASHALTIHLFDSEQYFVTFGCGPNGEKFVWLESRNVNPDAKAIALLHNKLAELGNGWSEVRLRLSDCPAI